MRPFRKCGYLGAMIVALALLVASVAVGCTDLNGGGGGGDTTDTSADVSTTAGPTTTVAPETTTTVAVTSSDTLPATTTTAGPPPSTVTTEALSSAEQVLPNGNIRAMGFIDEAFEYGMRSIRIDFAEFLTGDEAEAAAIAAGDLAPGEDLPNDYYISNVNPLKRDFDVSDSVAITTATRGGGFDEPATWNEFMTWFGPSPPPGTEHLHAMPWWIERDATTNLVIRIDEQYIP